MGESRNSNLDNSISQNEVEQLIPFVENLDDNENDAKSGKTQMEFNALNRRDFGCKAWSLTPPETQSNHGYRQNKELDENRSLESLSDAHINYNEVSPSEYNAMNQRFENDHYRNQKTASNPKVGSKQALKKSELMKQDETMRKTGPIKHVDSKSKTTRSPP